MNPLGDGVFENLARQLMTPAKSGVYLTRNELLVLARASEASLRINERPRMLVDILRSAQTADELCAMVDRLVAFTKDSIEKYRELAEAYPTTRAAWQPWIDRASRAVVFLDDVKREVRL